MFKLYRRDGHGIAYREAWIAGQSVVEHWGRCGARGEVKEHIAETGKEQSILDRLHDAGIAAGFTAVDDEDWEWLLVQRPIDGFGTEQDLSERHALEDFLNELLGWYGLGLCDGGSIGSGTIEAACPVIDYEIARAAIEPDLAASPFSEWQVVRES